MCNSTHQHYQNRLNESPLTCGQMWQQIAIKSEASQPHKAGRRAWRRSIDRSLLMGSWDAWWLQTCNNDIVSLGELVEGRNRETLALGLG